MNYPRWLTEPLDGMNLREVAPGLYIGEATAPLRGNWHTIIDFFGHAPWRVQLEYPRVRRYIRIPFEDGSPFPKGALDAAWDAWQLANLDGGDTLIHCQAGLSRSASAAYALLRRRYGMRHEEALSRVVTPLTAHQFPLRETLRSAADWARGARRA